MILQWQRKRVVLVSLLEPKKFGIFFNQVRKVLPREVFTIRCARGILPSCQETLLQT